MSDIKQGPQLLAFPGQSGVQVVETGVRDSPIESVVVYQDRAEVKRRLTVHLAAGENEVIISDLADCLDKNSVRVEGKGKAVITDVIYSSKESCDDGQVPMGNKEEYQCILDEIAEVRKELRHVHIKRDVLNEEKALLNKFTNHIATVHTVKGKDGMSSISELVSGEKVSIVLEYFQKVESKMSDLDSRLNVIAAEERTLQEKLAVLQANADKVNPHKKKLSAVTVQQVRTLHVGLEAAEEGEAILFVSYVVSNASWSSSYDVRVFTKDKNMKVQYYGLIKQVTGEDWEDAKISLSTAQPSVGGSAPPLPTKIIRFKRPRPMPVPSFTAAYSRAPLRSLVSSAKRGLAVSDSECDEDDLSSTDLDDDWGEDGAIPPPPPPPGMGGLALNARLAVAEKSKPPPAPPALDIAVAEVTTGLFNTTYDIPRATTIPADNTEHKVTVALIDLSPELTYSSVPQLSPYSFLQAKAKNSSPYTILAGPANIFLDNNFIAKSEMSDVSPNEEFTTSLGADQSIRITVRPVSSVHNTRGGLLGGAKTNCITFTHSFVVKNTRSDSVHIKVSEQVPLSTDERIKVIVSVPSVKKVGERCTLPFGHALLNESNNLEWLADVGAGSELELKLVYTVEHPAQDGVEGLPK